MTSKETNDERGILKKFARGDLDMILIEQIEAWGAVSNLQRAIFNTGRLKIRRGSVHRFDCFVRRIVGRSPGLK